MEQTLLDFVLVEINKLRRRYEHADTMCSAFLGAGIATGIILPVFTLLTAVYAWFTERPIYLGRAIPVGLVSLFVIFGLWAGWRIQRDRLFRRIRAHALKLQCAGYTVYNSGSGLSAKTGPLPEGAEVLDFDTISTCEMYNSTL